MHPHVNLNLIAGTTVWDGAVVLSHYLTETRVLQDHMTSITGAHALHSQLTPPDGQLAPGPGSQSQGADDPKTHPIEEVVAF